MARACPSDDEDDPATREVTSVLVPVGARHHLVAGVATPAGTDSRPGQEFTLANRPDLRRCREVGIIKGHNGLHPPLSAGNYGLNSGPQCDKRAVQTPAERRLLALYSALWHWLGDARGGAP